MKFNKFIYLTLSILSLNISLFGMDLEEQVSNSEDSSNIRISEQIEEDRLNSQESNYDYIRKFNDGMKEAISDFVALNVGEFQDIYHSFNARMNIIDGNINAISDWAGDRINQQQNDINNINNWIKDRDNNFTIQNSSNGSNSNKKIFGVAAIALIMGAGIASYKKVYNYIKTKFYKSKLNKSKDSVKRISLSKNSK